jgi:hypothetical protein
MSDFRSDDHNPEGCPGCRPVVFDPQSGELDEEATAAAWRAFDAASTEARKAWHRVTCLNSRDQIDVNLAGSIIKALEKEMGAVGEKRSMLM